MVVVSSLCFRLGGASLLGYKILVYNQHSENSNRMENIEDTAGHKDRLCFIDFCFSYTFMYLYVITI